MLNGLGRHIGAAEGTIAIGDHFDVDGAAVCILWVPAKQCSREQRRPQVSQCALCWIRQTLHFSIPNQYLHTHCRVQLLMSGHESSATCFGGQHIPQKPKDLA